MISLEAAFSLPTVCTNTSEARLQGPLHTTEQLSASSGVTFLMPHLKGKLGSFVSMIITICTQIFIIFLSIKGLRFYLYVINVREIINKFLQAAALCNID